MKEIGDKSYLSKIGISSRGTAVRGVNLQKLSQKPVFMAGHAIPAHIVR